MGCRLPPMAQNRHKSEIKGLWLVGMAIDKSTGEWEEKLQRVFPINWGSYQSKLKDVSSQPNGGMHSIWKKTEILHEFCWNNSELKDQEWSNIFYAETAQTCACKCESKKCAQWWLGGSPKWRRQEWKNLKISIHFKSNFTQSPWANKKPICGGIL